MSPRTPPRRRRRRTMLAASAALMITLTAVALVRTGHIGQSQDLATAWADEPVPTAASAAKMPDAPAAPETTPAAPETAPTEPPAAAPPPETPAPATTAVAVYWPHATGDGLVASTSDVSTVAPLGGALAALAHGRMMPPDVAPVPQAQAIQAIRQRGDIAVIDFDATFADSYPAGSAEEIAMLAPLVYTATAQDGITGVLITVNGAPPVTSGSFDLNEPLTRASFPGLDR